MQLLFSGCSSAILYSQILYWKWRLQHPQGQEGELSASSRGKKGGFLRKWESHWGLEPSHLESLGGKLWGQEGSSAETERTHELTYVLLHGGKELHKQERRVLEFGYNFQLRFQFLLSEHGS